MYHSNSVENVEFSGLVTEVAKMFAMRVLEIIVFCINSFSAVLIIQFKITHGNIFYLERLLEKRLLVNMRRLSLT